MKSSVDFIEQKNKLSTVGDMHGGDYAEVLEGGLKGTVLRKLYNNGAPYFGAPYFGVIGGAFTDLYTSGNVAGLKVRILRPGDSFVVTIQE